MRRERRKYKGAGMLAVNSASSTIKRQRKYLSSRNAYVISSAIASYILYNKKSACQMVYQVYKCIKQKISRQSNL
jgi:hypothetical protein